jgi:hypothetical protein
MAIIPELDDWITFPLEQHRVVEIEWWNDNTHQSARYYVDECWFGERKSSTDSKADVKPKGKSSRC